MKSKQFSLRARINSIRFACEGIYRFFADEHNTRVHLVASILVIIAAIRFGVTKSEMAILAIAIGIVWIAEIFNTAVERLADFIAPSYDPRIKVIKDLSAAAVLVAAAIAVVAGSFIFIPKIF